MCIQMSKSGLIQRVFIKDEQLKCTESHIALNLPAKYKFYTKYELSYEDRSRSVSGLKMSPRACRTKM